MLDWILNTRRRYGAARTVQDRACHAIHVDFLFPGDPKIPIEYGVRRVRDGRLVYLASPGGAPPTPFTAIEVGERRVVFENATHDFPQRVIYWRDGTALRARIEGTRNGRLAFEEWRWDAAPPPARQ